MIKCDCLKNKDLCSIIAVLVALFLGVLIISTAVDINDKIQKTEDNVITVSDTGTVYAKPDLAVTTFSVNTEAKTVGEALAENTKKMNAVIAFVKNKEVEEKDLKTTGFNIYPRYEWHKESSIYPEGERVLVGYEVNQSLQVKIRDLSNVGLIIEGATEAGSNQIGNLQFTVDDQDELKEQARASAINKAKEKAKKLADQLGVKLVRIKSFSESGVVPVPKYSSYVMEEAFGIGGGEISVEAGENKIEVTVHLTYDIK